MLREVMAATRSTAASTGPLLRAHIVIEAMLVGRTMFRLQKTISL
jgi:hypothetical protein